MSDELGILIKTQLDTSDIPEQLNKLSNELARAKNGKLKIIGRLNTSATIKTIEKQLTSLKIDSSSLKITPQLEVSGKSGAQVFKNIQDSANTTTKTLQDLRQELLEIDKTRADFRFKAGVNDNGEDLKKTLENARKLFSAYKDIDDIQFKWSADESGEVNKISAIIKSVTGQVETLRFELQQTNGVYNDVFAFVGSSSGDTGIAKATKEAEKLAVKTEETRTKYTRLLEEFKSSNSAIQSGLTNPIKEFEDVLKGLGTTHSISDVINQFEKLKTSAAEISQYLGTTNSSFNKNTNAINNYNQMDDAIKRIEASYGNLTVKNDKLGESVTNLRSMYEALVATEKERGGTTVTWAQEYQKVNAVLKEVKTNIEAAVRAESSSKEADKNSQYQIQARHLKSIVEAQKQIVQLSRQRLSADEAESAELDRQIKNARQRIRDNTKYLVDKDLYSGVAKQIADSTKAMDEQLKLIGAKQTDSIKKNYQDMSNAISKTVEKLKSLQSQPLFETKGNAGVAQLSSDVKVLIKDYEKLQKSMMGSTPNSQNLDHFAEKLVEIDQRSKTVQATFGSLKTSVSESAKAEALAQKEAEKLAQSYTQMSSTIANATTEMVKLKQSPILGDSKNTEYVTQLETEIQKIIEDYNALYQAMNKNGNQTPVNYEIFSQELAKISQRAIEAKAALDGLKADNTQQKQLATDFEQVSKSVNKVISDLDTMSRTPIFNTHSNNAGVIEFKDKIKGLSDTAKQVKADLNALGDSKAIPPELRTRVDNLRKSFDELNGSNKTLQANLRQSDGWARTERQIQTLTARIKEYMATNTKAAKKYSSQFTNLLGGLSQAGLNKDSEAVRRLSADFQILKSQIKAAGDTGKTLGQTIVDNVKRFSSWMTLTGLISTGVRELRKMVSTVIELDTAMTNLRKVTNETEGTYSKFLKNATTQAKELGMAVTDLIDSTSDFAKLGYSLPDATELAKVASVYANVGELNISDATSSLVSTLAAFKIEAKDAISVVDRLNAVGNSFSISSADIGEALQRSASSLHTANNTLDESIALITAAKQYWLRIWKHIYRIHLTALIA